MYVLPWFRSYWPLRLYSDRRPKASRFPSPLICFIHHPSFLLHTHSAFCHSSSTQCLICQTPSWASSLTLSTLYSSSVSLFHPHIIFILHSQMPPQQHLRPSLEAFLSFLPPLSEDVMFTTSFQTYPGLPPCRKVPDEFPCRCGLVWCCSTG